MKKGFTLIELLIVIGILAILTAAVVVVLNPAELLKQARDSQRMSDLDSVKSAVSLYLATASTPDLTEGITGDAARTTAATSTYNPFTTITNYSISSTTAINGTGWVTVKLSDTSGGSPLSALPLDPVNNTNYFYGWAADESANTFELDARLESSKYSGKMTTDGGSSADFYEIGTDPGLDL